MHIIKLFLALVVSATSITLIDRAMTALSHGNALAAAVPLMIAIIGLVSVLCIALSCLLAPSHNPSISTRA